MVQGNLYTEDADRLRVFIHRARISLRGCGVLVPANLSQSTPRLKTSTEAGLQRISSRVQHESGPSL